MGRIAVAITACALFGAIGCSGESEDDDDDIGSSGLPGDAYMDELTPGEIRTLCEWAIDAQGGPGTKACPDGTTVNTPTVESCTAGNFDAHCPIRLIEVCMSAIDGDPCLVLTSSACEQYVYCILSGGV